MKPYHLMVAAITCMTLAACERRDESIVPPAPDSSATPENNNSKGVNVGPTGEGSGTRSDYKPTTGPGGHQETAPGK